MLKQLSHLITEFTVKKNQQKPKPKTYKKHFQNLLFLFLFKCFQRSTKSSNVYERSNAFLPELII